MALQHPQATPMPELVSGVASRLEGIVMTRGEGVAHAVLWPELQIDGLDILCLEFIGGELSSPLQARIIRIAFDSDWAAFQGVRIEPGGQVIANFDEAVRNRILGNGHIDFTLGEVNAFQSKRQSSASGLSPANRAIAIAGVKSASTARINASASGTVRIPGFTTSSLALSIERAGFFRLYSIFTA